MAWCSYKSHLAPVENFYLDRRVKAGVNRGRVSYCKDCCREYHRKRRQNLEEQVPRRKKVEPYQPRLSEDWKERWFLMTGIRPK